MSRAFVGVASHRRQRRLDTAASPPPPILPRVRGVGRKSGLLSAEHLFFRPSAGSAYRINAPPSPTCAADRPANATTSIRRLSARQGTMCMLPNRLDAHNPPLILFLRPRFLLCFFAALEIPLLRFSAVTRRRPCPAIFAALGKACSCPSRLSAIENPLTMRFNSGASPSPTDNPDAENNKDAGTVHQETVSPISPSTTATASKWKLSRGDGDAAMSLFRDPAEIHEPHDPAEEKRLVRKIDFMILPYLAVCYAFFYIDKTTLSYAAIFGIREDLDLQGAEYNWLSSKPLLLFVRI